MERLLFTVAIVIYDVPGTNRRTPAASHSCTSSTSSRLLSTTDSNEHHGYKTAALCERVIIDDGGWRSIAASRGDSP